MTALRQTILILDVSVVGLMAGLFCAFSYAVMPGLHRTDARTFVSAMQKMNVAIINPVFVLLFIGGLIVTGAAAWMFRHDPMAPWAIAAFVLYVIGFIVTIAVNVPLNDRLADATDPEAARAAFETAWVRWNIVRSVLHTGAFVALVAGTVVARSG